MTKVEKVASEVERIHDQLHRAFAGSAWHGPAVMEVLEGVTAAQAAARPVPKGHSIWELTLHIAAWENAALRRLDGDPASLSDEEDWPPVLESGAVAWKAAIQRLEDGHRLLEGRVLRLRDSDLSEKSARGSTLYTLLHGVIQHDLYHAGQIAILKK